jgi:alpha-ketoglutarate-dependent taurine dioxygenase
MSINQRWEQQGIGAASGARRKAIDTADLVECRPLIDGRSVPCLMQPTGPAIDGAAWMTRHRALVDEKLAAHGAVLFRDFGIRTVVEFHAVVAAATGGLMQYRERSSPRSEVADRIYTSTDYPADQSIFPHNEHSYSLTFPSKLAFWCHIPPAEGGETPLADTRQVYRRIDPAVREKFDRLGWMYVRNFDNAVGLPWPVVFQTADRAEVEAYCRTAGIRCEWKPDNRLRTRQVRPTTIAHPKTGELSWFNHMAFFHITTLSPAVAASLRHEYREEDLPNNTYYGDGSPIEEDTVEHIREAYRAEMVSFPWQKGDLVLVDNISTAHARQPFAGPRRILVALAEPIARPDAASLGLTPPP